MKAGQMFCVCTLHLEVLLFWRCADKLDCAVQRGGGRYQNGEANYGRPTIPLTELIAEVMSKQEVRPCL